MTTTALGYIFLLAELIVIISGRDARDSGYTVLESGVALLREKKPTNWIPLIGLVLSILAQIVVGVLVWFGAIHDQLLILSTAAGILEWDLDFNGSFREC